MWAEYHVSLHDVNMHKERPGGLLAAESPSHGDTRINTVNMNATSQYGNDTKHSRLV
jgi:hypothetical protein